MFYGAINIGAAMSASWPCLAPHHYGYAIAFLFPAGADGRAFAFFAAGKPFYAVETDPAAASRRPKSAGSGCESLLRRMLGLFLVVAFFWAIFDQIAQHLDSFATRPSRSAPLRPGRSTPDQLQAINPVLILVLLPPITMLWQVLARPA